MRRPRLQLGQVDFEFPTIQDFSKPAVELHKNGRYLLFKALDPIAADTLRDLMERMEVPAMRALKYWSIDLDENDTSSTIQVKDWKKIELWKHLKGDIAKHPLCRILKANGIEVGTVPTLANYIRKEWRRQQIESTPFPMPAVSGDASLFQRCSVGTNLLCVQSYTEPGAESPTFEKGKHYLVVSTGGNGNDVVKISTTQLADNVTLADNAAVFEWSTFHPEMEQYFDDSEEADFGATVEEAYPELVASMRKKMEKLNYPIFEHTFIDASMEALKRGFLNCKLMRMGKTREAITVVNLWGSQKVCVFGSENVRLTWEKEFKKIGLTDYVMVDCLADLDKPGRFYLMKYGWIRKKTDPTDLERRKHRNYLRESERSVSRQVSWDYRSKSVLVYQHNPCPHCGAPMERPELKRDSTGKVFKVIWVRTRGYMCRNPKCVWKSDNRKMKGAAWQGKIVKHKPGTYVDWGLAAHANCPKDAVHGRQCTCCKETDGVWKPQLTKRFKKNFTVVIADEVHHIKDRSTQTAEAVYRMRARRKIGLTGTLLSNSAMDAYWIMSWVIGGPSENFPYLYHDGKTLFENRFCEHAILEKPTGEKDEETGEEITKTVRRRLPYFKNAPDWWRFSAPKILRRNYMDPLYLQSLEQAGMKMPRWEVKTMTVPMVPKQIKLMLSALKDFKDVYEKAVKEAKEKNQEINKTFVMSQMTAMRIVATIPSFINKRFDEKVYDGVPGGGKMYHIATAAKDRILSGGKVVILTDFIEMQKEVEKELQEYGVIRFDTSWDADQRREALEKFNEDPETRAMVAGTRAVSESLDFSVADTCICGDILWSPADQCQAWSRILTPTERDRDCEILVMLSKNSIDEHMYNVFYSKLRMSEQGMDRRTINRRAAEINYQWFAERVIQEEANLTLQIRGTDLDDQKVLVVADQNEGLWEEDRVA
jgi:hypothetical protein